MSLISVNDIFQELSEENNRLLNELTFADKCLKIFIEFKSFVDFISIKFKHNLETNESQKYDKLSEKLSQVLLLMNLPVVKSEPIETNDCLSEEISPKSRTNSLSIRVKKEKIVKTAKNVVRSQRKNKPKNKSKENKVNSKLQLKSKLNDKQKIAIKNSSENSSKINKKIKLNEKSLAGDSKTQKEKIREAAKKLNVRSVKSLNKNLLKTRIPCTFIGCERYFLDNRLFEIHLKSHTGEQIVEELVCDHEGCNFRTPKKNRLTKHKWTHITDKQFQCSICEKRFPSDSYRRGHIRRVHETSVTQLVCGIDGCEKTCKNELAMKGHRYRCHLYEQKYVCDLPGCLFKTSSKTALEYHLKSHSDERPYKCSVDGCDKAFKILSQMEQHVKQVHFTGSRIKCSHEGCQQYFKSKRDIKMHANKVHSTDCLPCLWPGCDYTARYERQLKDHSVVHSDDFKFHCDWPQCGKAFKRRGALADHMRIHTNDRKFGCHWPGCQYATTNTANLSKHMKQVHKKKKKIVENNKQVAVVDDVKEVLDNGALDM